MERTLMQEALNRVRDHYGTHLRLSQARPGSVLPHVDVEGCEIRFNSKLPSFLTLYNLMIQQEDADSECVTLFRLYNLYLDNDAYTLAEETLRQLEHELDSFERQLRHSDIRSVRQAVEIQTLFFLLHEAAHAVFYRDTQMRQEFITEARGRVEEVSDIPTDNIPDRMKNYLRTFVPDGLPEELQQAMLEGVYSTFKQHVDDIYDFARYLRPEQEWILEECACDHFAWQRALVQYMETVGMGGDAVLQSNIDLQLTLHIYAYDKAMESVFTNADTEAKIEQLREDGIRRAALRQHIDDFYQKIYPADHGSLFLRLAEERDERAKRLLVCSTIHHISDMNTLQALPSEPFSEPRVAALEARFEEIVKRVDDLIVD